jgi:hypothetical protein
MKFVHNNLEEMFFYGWHYALFVAFIQEKKEREREREEEKKME